jgi:hypothetical protein
VTFDARDRRLQPAASSPSLRGHVGHARAAHREGTVQVSRVLSGRPRTRPGSGRRHRSAHRRREVTEASYFKLKDRLKDGETVTIELRRADKPITATVKLRRLV